MKIILHPAAQAELEEIDHYWSVVRSREDLADNFILILNEKIAEIEDPIIRNKTYKKLWVRGEEITVKRCMYFKFRGNTCTLYFVEEPEGVLVLALANAKQEPDYWMERVFD